MKLHHSRDNLYILYSVDAWECTEEEIETKFQILCVKYPHWTREKFLDSEDAREAKVTVKKEIIGYYTDEAEAFCRAILDAERYTDGGARPYGVVVRLPADCGHPMPERLWIFRYDKETKRGAIVNPGGHIVTRGIVRNMCGFTGPHIEEECPI